MDWLCVLFYLHSINTKTINNAGVMNKCLVWFDLSERPIKIYNSDVVHKKRTP